MMTVGVIGLGYVGLPLAVLIASKGIRVIGYENEVGKVGLLLEGKSYIDDVPEETVVEPLWVLEPSSVRVAFPDLVTEPVPEMFPEKVPLAVWLKRTAALLAMLPVIEEASRASVPPEMVVPPV